MFGAPKPGGLLGSTTTSSAATLPTFGSGFGTNTTGFGAPAKPAFGSFGTTTTPSSTGFNFGQTPAGGGTLFGAKTTAPSLFGGTTTTSAPSSGFGLGTGLGTSGGFKLGGTTTTTTAGGLFGGGTTGGLFGSTSTGLGSATTPATGGLLGTQQQQANQQQQATGEQDLSALATAVTLPLLFNDERDSVIAKWNQLQAFWGTGRGYYTQSGGHIDFTPENTFCKFKAAGYSRLPSAQDEDGLVAVSFNKPTSQLKEQQQQIVEGIAKLLGNQPTLTVCIDDVSELPNNATQVVLYVLERAANGSTRRVGASQLHRVLCGLSSQLQAAGVSNVTPRTTFSSQQLRDYLENPPAGLNPVLWQQAKLDNPDVKSFLPVPLLGFKELSRRTSQQQHAVQAHQGRLKLQREKIQKLQSELQAQQAQIEQSKRHALDLSHRLLKVICKQEVWRRQGQGVAADEEQLRIALESLHTDLAAPTQCKGRLNEMLSRVRLRQQSAQHQSHMSDERYQLDATMQQEIQQHLAQQQAGLEHLVMILQQDMDDLQLIRDDLPKLSTVH